MLYSAIASMTLMGLTLGFLLGLAGRYLKVESNPIIDELVELMPGSQCGQCGFPGCAPAAEALVEGTAPVTLCPPGGRALVELLAERLSIDIDLDSIEEKEPAFAAVSEETCIGCTRCFKVCPTDAIMGGPKQIHQVFREACTGCEACIEVCPTECLHMEGVEITLGTWRWPKPALAA